MVGEVQLAQGDPVGALTSYRDTLAISDRLAKMDPGNANWQRHLSLSLGMVGRMQVAQGDLAGALASFSNSLANRERVWRKPSLAMQIGSAIWRCRALKSRMSF